MGVIFFFLEQVTQALLYPKSLMQPKIGIAKIDIEAYFKIWSCLSCALVFQAYKYR